MTQEEKAKAYDDALKRAKAAIDIAADKDLVKGVATTIFPELRESEDERVRKFIYDYIADSYWMKDWNVSQEECLAWLEKQKEQKPAEWSEEDEKMRNLAIEWAETMSGQISFVDMDSTDFRKIIAWLKSLHPQPKPEWSEEDKKLIDDVINSLCCYQNTLSDYQKEIVGEEIRKLKSLKPQSKQEWSDDDKKMIERIVGSLYSLKCYVQDNVSYSEIIKDDIFKRIEREQNWLKSLPFNFKKKLD